MKDVPSAYPRRYCPVEYNSHYQILYSLVNVPIHIITRFGNYVINQDLIAQSCGVWSNGKLIMGVPIFDLDYINPINTINRIKLLTVFS